MITKIRNIIKLCLLPLTHLVVFMLKFCYLIVSVNTKGKLFLGNIFDQMRGFAHKNHIAELQKKYTIDPTFICGRDTKNFGANSIVTHDIPANSVYGGTPARLIKKKFKYQKT